MLTFVALNDQSNRETEEDLVSSSRELSIQQSLSQYAIALELHRSQKINEAREAYEALLKTKVFKEKLEPIANIHASQIHTLYFVVYKNYAALLRKEGNKEDSLHYYLKARDLDLSDLDCSKAICSIFQELGKLDEAYTLLRECFENTYLRNDRIYFGEALARFAFDLGFFPDAYLITKLVLEFDVENTTCKAIRYEIIASHISCYSETSIFESLISTKDIWLHKKNKGLIDRHILRNVPKPRLAEIIAVFVIEVDSKDTLYSFAQNLLKGFAILYG